MKLTPELDSLRFQKFRAPANSQERQLPFMVLDPGVFERLCCDLIYEIHNKGESDFSYKVMHIGVSGQKQYGADIIVRKDNDDGCEIFLFEVKRVEKYSLTLFKSTIDRFLSNYEIWNDKPTRFTIFVASELSADLINQFFYHIDTLGKNGIKYDIKMSTDIQRMLMHFPQIVYKYFNGLWVEQIFGKATLKSIENYNHIDSSDSASWDEYTDVIEDERDSEFIYQNEYVRLHCYLPHNDEMSSSCLVEMRSGRFSHVLITLSSEELLNNQFVGIGAPSDSGVRPFLLKSSVGQDLICDLGSCRIFLSKEEADCICQAFDKYWLIYKNRLDVVSNIRNSACFPVYRGSKNGVAMMRITRGLWSKMIQFSSDNDAFRSKGEWSIFDSNQYYLKIYNNPETEDLDPGYHSFIHPIETDDLSNAQTPDPYIVLVWRPIDSMSYIESDEMFHPRRRWDVLTTHNWLKDVFIPKVLNDEHSHGGEVSLWRPKKEASFSLSEDWGYSFLRPEVKDEFGLKRLEIIVTKSQLYFSLARNIYVPTEAFNRLFSVLFVIFENTKKLDFHYLNGNLSYLNAVDYKDLKVKVLQFSRENKDACDNYYQLDCIFRCACFCLQNSVNGMSNELAEHLCEDLGVLYSMAENQELIDSQLERLGCF